MGWTKEDIIAKAFDELGISNYKFDLDPEQIDSALKSLDSMMANWYAKGIKIGYALSITPSGVGASSQSNVPMWAIEPIYTNLALRLAPSLGKTVPPELKQSAKEGMNTISINCSMPSPRKQIPGVPLGAGNKPWVYDSGPFTVVDDEDGNPDFENFIDV